jgi:hypothetical protein
MELALCPAGNLAGELGIKPEGHIFVSSKAPWYNIADSLPQHAEYPPEFATPGIARPVVTSRPDTAQGSCLCGEVAFEIDGTPATFWYCHCSRCRRQRSAAHAANVFLKADQFHWVRGESQVTQYKVPEARFFIAAFCRHCGGAAPRVAAQSGMAQVPAGTFDTDPGIRPQAHIFAASKASWFDICDDIAQFPEGPPRAPI